MREVTDQQKEEARMSFVVLDWNGRIGMHSCYKVPFSFPGTNNINIYVSIIRMIPRNEIENWQKGKETLKMLLTLL